MTFGLRLIDQNVGGFGFEFRTDLHLGFLTQFSAEYYHLLNQWTERPGPIRS